MPVWGDAQWDLRGEERGDGSWDLVEARASVAAIRDEQEDSDMSRVSQRPATFPQEKLRWVPRKRHNSRWPIEPTMPAQITMVADLQPLVEFEIPSASIDSAAVQHSPQRATEKQMRRRSTRRLSTRASLAHVEDVSVHLSPIARGNSHIVTTPTKSSPTKAVSASAQKLFTLLATPTKVLFRPSPAKGRSPAKRQSPLRTAKLPTPTPINQASVAEDPSLLSESSVLVFEQPPIEGRTEPPHETRRRVSLHNAMRLERSSVVGRRSLDWGHLDQAVLNRRHSSIPQLCATPLEFKNRRHTLDVSGESNTMETVAERDDDTTAGLSSAETTENISEVVVDVCANLDIFGQKSGVSRRHRTRRSSAQQATLPAHAYRTDAVSSPQSATSHSSHGIDDSSMPVGLGITLDGEFTDRVGSSPAQAAMLDNSFSMPTEDGDEADTPRGDFWLDDGIGSTPCERLNEVKRDDEVQQDDMFAPHDPEGLSTIFEDDEVSLPLSTPPQRAVGDAVDRSSSTSASATEDSRSAKMSSSSPKITANPGEHMAQCPASEDSAGSLEQAEQSAASHVEAMKQSFEFTMDADEAVQQTPSVDREAVLVTEQAESSPARMPTTSPPPIASARGGASDQEREHEQSDCSPSPRDDDNSIGVAEDDLCGIITVEDFPAREQTSSAEDASDKAQLDNASEHEDVGDADGSDPLSQVEVASSPHDEMEETDALSITPPQRAVVDSEVQDQADDAERVLETPPTKDRGKGFTPINADRISPPAQQPRSVRDADEEDAEEGDDLQDEDMALAIDYEPTVPINLDEETVAVEASVADAEPAALQEDSETEMLRKFVTRVSANKAAAALARRSLRPRRSGSTGSTTSVTGSPAAKPSASLSAESAQRMMAASMCASPAKTRLPLGEKDTNSPSPTKKRKAAGVNGKSTGKTHSDDLFKGNPALYSAEISPPKSKRLRSRRRVETESDTPGPNGNVPEQQHHAGSEDNPAATDPSSSGPAPRRSTRSRNSRVHLKAPAPSANSIALSLIPVRLSGLSGVVLAQADTSGDKDMPTPVVASRANRTTAEEKDLAAVTRVNTRKNKGGAVPPKVVLSRQAEDPLGFKLREVKGVFDGKEEREGEEVEHDGGEEENGRVSRKGKGVRWASELVRFNTDLEVVSPRLAPMSGPLVPVRKGARVVPVEESADDEASAAREVQAAVVAAAPEEEVAEQEPLEEKQQAQTKPAAPARRTRQSRLQAPTPVSKKILADAAPAATKAASAGGLRMATRRTKIASLGMGVNGTPAPKRRTRA